MTTIDPETRIPDPIELDEAEEARLRAAAGLGPVPREGGEYAGFESVGIPDRPPQTDRERDVYTLNEGEMLINLGPQHPSTHGVMRLVVKVRGEVIVDIDPVLGYLHRGIEKLCENATYTTVLTYVDPMDYLSSMHNEHAPAIAFEKLYGIKAPPRAEYIRALVVELNRVFSHGSWTAYASDVRMMEPQAWYSTIGDSFTSLIAAPRCSNTSSAWLMPASVAGPTGLSVSKKCRTTPMRIPFTPLPMCETKSATGRSALAGSAASYPAIAWSSSAQSSTLQAIGPA